MNDRLREILSWYASENPGVRTNLARMLNHGRLAGTGRMVILPIDQGFEHGPARSFAPNPAAYDPRFHFALAIEAGCNAYAAPLGSLEAGVSEYCGEIPLIIKCSNHDLLYEERDPLSAVTSWVEDALRLGCVLSDRFGAFFVTGVGLDYRCPWVLLVFVNLNRMSPRRSPIDRGT